MRWKPGEPNQGNECWTAVSTEEIRLMKRKLHEKRSTANTVLRKNTECTNKKLKINERPHTEE